MFDNHLDVETYEQQYEELQRLRETPSLLAELKAQVEYPVEAPASSRAECEKLYEELQKHFHNARLEVREDGASYIAIDGGEPFMRIVQY